VVAVIRQVAVTVAAAVAEEEQLPLHSLQESPQHNVGLAKLAQIQLVVIMVLEEKLLYTVTN
jgi:hypothetical protein